MKVLVTKQLAAARPVFPSLVQSPHCTALGIHLLFHAPPVDNKVFFPTSMLAHHHQWWQPLLPCCTNTCYHSKPIFFIQILLLYEYQSFLKLIQGKIVCSYSLFTAQPTESITDMKHPIVALTAIIIAIHICTQTGYTKFYKKWCNVSDLRQSKISISDFYLDNDLGGNGT